MNRKLFFAIVIYAPSVVLILALLVLLYAIFQLAPVWLGRPL